MSNAKLTVSKTEALAALYRAVAASRAAKPKAVRERSPEDRAAYMRDAKRRSREKTREEAENGRPVASDEAIRAVLSDAAIIILAAGGPSADAIQRLVHRAFPGRTAVASTTRARCQATTLRPLVLTPERLAAKD